jgi:predicted nucleic acid-binding protein
MVIADTGFFIALGNKKDNFHDQAKQQIKVLREPLITTYPVIVETSYLLCKRCGNKKQLIFLRQLIQGNIQIFQLNNYHLQRILELMVKHSNLPMDLADASLVVLEEEINDNRILSTDFRDSTIYRCHNN